MVDVSDNRDIGMLLQVGLKCWIELDTACRDSRVDRLKPHQGEACARSDFEYPRGVAGQQRPNLAARAAIVVFRMCLLRSPRASLHVADFTSCGGFKAH